MNLKKSSFNHAYSSDKNTILFNSVTEAMYLFKNEDYEIYKNDFNSLDTNTIETLSKNGFLINDQINEFKRVEYSRARKVFNEDTKVITILTSTACNARCHYCYEAGYKFKHMSNETILDTINFLKKFIKGSKKLVLYWFGGEPLTNYKVIDEISKEIIPYCEENKIRYTARMYTNASLIDDFIFNKIKNDWHINNIQITVDGYKQVYDDIKKFQGIKFNYDSLRELLKLLTDNDIHISIRLNIDKLNFDSILTAVEDLYSFIPKKDNISFYIYPLYSYADSKPNPSLISTNELGEYYCKFVDKLIEIGYIKNYDFFNIGYSPLNCYASSLGGIVIDQLGNITKCQHCAGNLEQSVGNVKEGIVFNDNYSKWCNITLPEDCMQCSFLPMCEGGCLANVYLRETTFGKCPIDRYLLTHQLKYILSMYEQKNK